MNETKAKQVCGNVATLVQAFFSPAAYRTPVLQDEELEQWGEWYERERIRADYGITFVAFMQAPAHIAQLLGFGLHALARRLNTAERMTLARVRAISGRTVVS